MKEKGISGSTLKIIAIVSMLIDHTAAVLLTGSENYMLYRSIGRLAFPIFCFLLVEGYIHTHDVKKYAIRLAVFALISEIPFDLAFSGKIVNIGGQNVFFTLLIGLAVLYAMNQTKKTTGKLLAAVLGMLAAGILQTDYSWIGVAAIVVLYQTRANRMWQSLAGAFMFFWEPQAIVAFLPIYFYNGKRGISMKYFFYIFYPAHLLVLTVLRYLYQGV